MSDSTTTTMSPTERIRAETREAVARFQEGRASEASSSGSTAIEEGQHGLDEPSDGQLAKAGMLGTVGAGQGGVAKRYLAAQSGAADREPRGWEEVDVPDKHGVLSQHLKSERRKVLKVSRAVCADH